MHFDVPVASAVSERVQHIGDRFCVVHGVIVHNKVLKEKNKIFPLPVPLRSLSFKTLHL